MVAPKLIARPTRICAALLVLGLMSGTGAQEAVEGLALDQVLGAQRDEGFAVADRVRILQFPRDHGPHPDFKHEWWYYTGNLRTTTGRRFGFQVTYFRIAAAPPAGRPARTSHWASDQVYMAHVAVSDVQGGQFHHAERFARGALGLAGASPELGDPPGTAHRVWLEDWQSTALPVDEDAPCASALASGRCLVVELKAAAGEAKLQLRLESQRPLVLQGEQGLSRKSSEPGNASYYYSFTRMAVSGALRLGGQVLPVTGQAWMDREWSTSALSEAQEGWDWFALQLDDGTDLMFYQLRRKDGMADPHSAGVLVGLAASPTAGSGANTVPLAASDVVIDVEDYWTSPHTGARYPARWRLRVPAASLDLRVTPHLADQELHRTQVVYWEGAVGVQGTREGRPVRGDGYVELAGYPSKRAKK